ncbi:hypothetical protein V1522DRAFT_436978 [Lipomyces starkeyi]
MDLPDDVNSSDVEFEQAPSKASGRRPVQASIAKIVEEASNDRLSSKSAKFENLRARITVEFRKGSKDKRNDNLEFYLRSLNDPNFYHMCPIALLLILALRHGLVLGTTIEQVLEYAANADAKVVWLFPDRPLFAAFSHKSTSECDLDNPAGNHQRMGIISNILCRVRQSLGHSHSAFHRERQFVSRWGPKFSETSAFNIVMQFENGSSSTSHPLWTLTPRPRGAVLGKTSAASASQGSCALRNQTRRRRRMERTKHWLRKRSRAIISIVPTACRPHSSAQRGFDGGQIDPRLLDENAFKNTQGLNCEVLMTSSQMSCTHACFEMPPTELSGNDMRVSALDFLYAYSKINIVCKEAFTRAWKRYCEGSTSFHDSIGRFCIRGNSHDDPHTDGIQLQEDSGMCPA